MNSILKFIRPYWKAMCLVVVFLLIQAYCDLMLPAYTSDIVDVGIQNSGIEHVTPQAVRRSELDILELFMKENQISYVEGLYTEEDGVCRLQGLHGDQWDQADEAFTLPIVIRSAMGDAAASLNREVAQAVRGQAEAQLEQLGDSMAEQTALAWVRGEAEACGLSLSSIQNSYLLRTGAKMMGLALLMLVVSVSSSFLASRVAASAAKNIRGQVFRKVVSFSNAEMDRFSTASLITRSTNDIQQVQMVIMLLLRMVLYAPIIGIGGVIRVLRTNTSMTWVIALAVVLVMGIVLVLVAVAMPRFKKMQTLVDRLNLVTREILTGLPVIRAFSRERYEEQRFDGANRDLTKTMLFTNRVMTFMMPSMMFVMNGMTVLIVWVGSHHIDQGLLQVGDLMAFITYTMQIIMAFLMLTMMSIILPRAIVAATRIQEVLDTESSIQDPENPQVPAEKTGVLEFRDVSFRYPNAEENVLEHISFTARPGETTAVIGSTGSGKSTLVNLIPRLYDVTEGQILLDGMDIRSMSREALRERLGYVPQKAILFSGSIADNLRYGCPEAPDEMVQKAAEIAQATEFIEAKPEKYETYISQGGTNVSGGQKQRLSIARAVAKNPEVYLFDDSFSALDYKTDSALRSALKQQVAGSTILIVAQRISTILHAEQILVLDEGRIVGAGTHQELLQTCEAYRQIAESQLSEAELNQVKHPSGAAEHREEQKGGAIHG